GPSRRAHRTRRSARGDRDAVSRPRSRASGRDHARRLRPYRRARPGPRRLAAAAPALSRDAHRLRAGGIESLDADVDPHLVADHDAVLDGLVPDQTEVLTVDRDRRGSTEVLAAPAVDANTLEL